MLLPKVQPNLTHLTNLCLCRTYMLRQYFAPYNWSSGRFTGTTQIGKMHLWSGDLCDFFISASTLSFRHLLHTFHCSACKCVALATASRYYYLCIFRSRYHLGRRLSSSKNWLNNIFFVQQFVQNLKKSFLLHNKHIKQLVLYLII